MLLAGALVIEPVAGIFGFAQGIGQQADAKQDHKGRPDDLAAQLEGEKADVFQQEIAAQQHKACIGPGEFLAAEQAQHQQEGGPGQAPEAHIGLHQIIDQQQRAHQQHPAGEADAAAAAGIPMEFPFAAIHMQAVAVAIFHHFRFPGGHLPGAQQLVHGDAEDLGQLGQRGNIGAGLVIFPFADGLGGHTQFFCQLILGHMHSFAVQYDPLA